MDYLTFLWVGTPATVQLGPLAQGVSQAHQVLARLWSHLKVWLWRVYFSAPTRDCWLETSVPCGTPYCTAYNIGAGFFQREQKEWENKRGLVWQKPESFCNLILEVMSLCHTLLELSLAPIWWAAWIAGGWGHWGPFERLLLWGQWASPCLIYITNVSGIRFSCVKWLKWWFLP